MPRTRKGKPSVPADAPRDGPRARTHQLLLDTAMRLAQSGRPMTVAEVASAAGVSRATAYRYFPSRSQLVNTIIGTALLETNRRTGCKAVPMMVLTSWLRLGK